MTKVKSELLFLKQKADDAAGKLSNDDSITNLQIQIKWFESEAVSLDSILEYQKREVDELKSYQRNTEADTKFLREEVKESMKQNKLLDVAV